MYFSQGACFSLCKIAIYFTKSRNNSGRLTRDKMFYTESAIWETFLKLLIFFLTFKNVNKAYIFLKTHKPITGLRNKALQI